VFTRTPGCARRTFRFILNGSAQRFTLNRVLPVSNRPGVTLIELLVVLLVIGLATALVVPSLIAPEPFRKSPVDEILGRVVDMATAREQQLELVVREDGRWYVRVPGSRESLADGPWPGGAGPSFALLVSSLGTCGPEPGTSPPFELDPLLCEVR
jgi:prepilin-type N-terminal cleavage/methylation domain-containing protein